MLTLNYRDSRPIYEQIKDGLRRMIVTGAMKQDEKLPSVRSLATQLSINPNTIQRAYNELEAEGYIYSVAGKGSFVSGTADADAARRENLKEDLRKLAGELRYLGMTHEDAMKLIKEDFKITREHGQWLEKAGVWMMAMYHPSALLRDPRKRPESFEDLKSLQAKIREVCVRTY